MKERIVAGVLEAVRCMARVTVLGGTATIYDAAGAARGAVDDGIVAREHR